MFSKLSPSSLVSLTKSLEKIESTKRKEENLKIALNWAFRELFEKFSQEMRSDLPKKPEIAFYSYYFGDLAENFDLEIKAFFKPNFKKSKKKRAKSFNKNFLQRIAKSSRFICDIEEVLKSRFVEQLSQSASHQLQKLLEKLDLTLSNSEDVSKSIEDVSEWFAKGDRIKLPWSNKELFQAVEITLSTLKSLSAK